MVLSWIIYSRKQFKYDIKENNYPGWWNKGPWYNTSKILGLNSFITITKFKKMSHEAMKTLFKQIPTINFKPLIHDKNTSCYWQIVAVRVTWHTWQPEIFFLLIRKHKYFLPMRGNLVVVCNLTDVKYSVAFNGVKWAVTHEWISSVFEMLYFYYQVETRW